MLCCNKFHFNPFEMLPIVLWQHSLSIVYFVIHNTRLSLQRISLSGMKCWLYFNVTKDIYIHLTACNFLEWKASFVQTGTLGCHLWNSRSKVVIAFLWRIIFSVRCYKGVTKLSNTKWCFSKTHRIWFFVIEGNTFRLLFFGHFVWSVIFGCHKWWIIVYQTL